MISDTTGYDGEIENYYSKCLVDRIGHLNKKKGNFLLKMESRVNINYNACFTIFFCTLILSTFRREPSSGFSLFY